MYICKQAVMFMGPHVHVCRRLNMIHDYSTAATDPWLAVCFTSQWDKQLQRNRVLLYFTFLQSILHNNRKQSHPVSISPPWSILAGLPDMNRIREQRLILQGGCPRLTQTPPTARQLCITGGTSWLSFFCSEWVEDRYTPVVTAPCNYCQPPIAAYWLPNFPSNKLFEDKSKG